MKTKHAPALVRTRLLTAALALAPILVAGCDAKSSDQAPRADGAGNKPAPSAVASASTAAVAEVPKDPPAPAPLTMTEVSISELGIALDFEAEPTIRDVFANDTSFAVRGATSKVELTVSDNGALKQDLTKVEARATALFSGSLEGVTKDEGSDSWNYVVTSKEKYPRWFLSTMKTVGKKSYTCEATTNSEERLKIAQTACASLRPKK